MTQNSQPLREQLAHTMALDAHAFYQHGWLFGTSGNLSTRLSADRFLITASGKDKGRLTTDDFLECDLSGSPIEQTTLRPSAETKLHCAIYAHLPEAGAVYHVHQLHVALCGQRDFEQGATTFHNVEMIKGLNIWEENCTIAVPIIENYFDLDQLAQAVKDFMQSPTFDTRIPGINISNHGIYAWGQNAFEAKRHIETFGYLFAHNWEQFKSGRGR